jgi:hypothetical protein
MKYWELIADRLSASGWSWGCVSAVDSNGRTIWIADAHRDDGKRFVGRADQKLTAFVELESAIRVAGFFPNSALSNGSESGDGHPPLDSSSFPDPQPTESSQRGKRKGRKNHESTDSIKKSNSTTFRRLSLFRSFARSYSR